MPPLHKFFFNLLFKRRVLVQICCFQDHQLRIVRYSLASSFDASQLGGLVVRRATSLAIPAFMASAASTLPLQDHTLALSPCPSDSTLEQYLSTWLSSADTDGIPDPCRENSPSGTRQVSWQIMHALSHLSFSSHREQGSWLHRHHTVASGC